MGDMYVVSMDNQTVVADATLIIVRTAAAAATRASRIRVHRVAVSQQGTSVSQQLGVILGVKASAFGTYTSTTPTPLNYGSVASGIAGGTAGAAATAGTDASAEGAGAVTTIIPEGFNNLSGYLYIPTPEERLTIGVDTAFVVKLRGTPTTLTGWNASLVYEEVD
jgi:hypothetical protein